MGVPSKLDILTEKQKKFIDHYSGNASEAAAAAGITIQHAYTLLSHPDIQKRLRDKVTPEMSSLTLPVADRDERLQFLTAVVRGDHTDIHTDKDGCESEVKATLKTRLKALELLGKAHCDFSEKRVIEGGDKPVEHRVNSRDLDDRIKNLIKSEPEFDFLS
jgi:hypothetical protein